jgi:hypothetical protein
MYCGRRVDRSGKNSTFEEDFYDLACMRILLRVLDICYYESLRRDPASVPNDRCEMAYARGRKIDCDLDVRRTVFPLPHVV